MITWPGRAAIAFGSALSAIQLNATANSIAAGKIGGYRENSLNFFCRIWQARLPLLVERKRYFYWLA
jgi:hypothetical protein